MSHYVSFMKKNNFVLYRNIPLLTIFQYVLPWGGESKKIGFGGDVEKLSSKKCCHELDIVQQYMVSCLLYCH